MAKKRKRQVDRSRSADTGFDIFKEHEGDWIFARTLEFMNERCAEIGECLYVARLIIEAGYSDIENWIREWAALADRVYALGVESLENNHRISARECFLRASNYYRNAEYACHPSHPRFHELWKKSVDSFQKAGELFAPPIQTIIIHYDGKDLPGYFLRPADDDQKRPTLISAGGGDSSLEEVVFWSGFAAVRRGYNFFTFEHPGHRGALHLYRDCIKIGNYEDPYRIAIDDLLTYPGVDNRLAMTGISWGGFVACRVAAFEKRLMAIAPNPPIIDEPFRQDWRKQGILSKIPAPWFDWIVKNRAYKRSPLLEPWVRFLTWSCGLPGEKWSEIFDAGTHKSLGYTVLDDIHRVTCPALLLVGEKEGDEWVRQAKLFYDGISSENKTLHIFTLEKDGSNDHCQIDNRSRGDQVMFDWLDELFDYQGI
jgi:pimeloyl-ACP methyl ester carboxylesterase